MYLYDFRNRPVSPPDPRLGIVAIATSMKMTQKEVKDELKGLCKRLYAKHFTYEGSGYCKIMPRGTREVEKSEDKTSELEISTDKIGYTRKKRETR
jgi:hypothetical protein